MKRMLTTEEILQITKNKTDIEALKSGKVNCYEATNLTTLTKDFINKLKAGDVVLKKTGTSYHAYRVSFKKDSEGICLTYTDAGYMETVSYDKSGTNWVYNSTDVVNVNRIEQIVDADGHNRFIDDNVQTGVITDVTFNYAKWSLSGTHLMIVIAGNTTASIPKYTLLASVNLPQWIKDKIYKLNNYSSVVSMTNLIGRTITPDAINTYKCTLSKTDEGVLNINAYEEINSGNYEEGFRLQFDLLID